MSPSFRKAYAREMAALARFLRLKRGAQRTYGIDGNAAFRMPVVRAAWELYRAANAECSRTIRA